MKIGDDPVLKLVLFILAGLLALVSCLILLLARSVYVTMQRTGRLKLVQVDVENADRGDDVLAVIGLDNWATEAGFEFEGCYRDDATSANLELWRHPQRGTRLARYVLRHPHQLTVSLDIVSLMERHISLTTNNTSNAHLSPPRPGSYVQTFSGLSHDRLLAHHDDALRLLCQRGGQREVRSPLPSSTLVELWAQRSLRHVRGFWFWPIRSIFWFFLRRPRWHGKSIAQQHELGWIRMPDQLSDAELETWSLPTSHENHRAPDGPAAG